MARRKEELEAVASKCRKAGASDVLVVPKDLTEAKGCEEAVNETVEHFKSELFLPV